MDPSPNVQQPIVDLDDDYYGMDDRDIEEVEISHMEAGNNVPKIRRRSFNTPIPPSPMLAPSRNSSGSTSCPPKKSKGTARTISRAWQFFDVVQKEDFGLDGKKIQTRLAKYVAVVEDDGDAVGEHDLRRSSKSGLESAFLVEIPFVSRGNKDDEPQRGEVTNESKKEAIGMAIEIFDDNGRVGESI
ncbi:hypothetical protein TIFTF001_046368 [Ficus carica]|uniref:Uncharacterized protein n=1 Tax=Ficus carica TaxID=3494 RepID=A0AA88D7Z3_FICCA|nr:hypothetical protein TIFTF001_046368 [Ficus carica]